MLREPRQTSALRKNDRPQGVLNDRNAVLIRNRYRESTAFEKLGDGKASMVRGAGGPAALVLDERLGVKAVDGPADAAERVEDLR